MPTNKLLDVLQERNRMMDNDEQLKTKAKVEYDVMVKHQKDIDEFNELGSIEVGIKDRLLIIAPLAILFIAGLFIDIDRNTYTLIFVVFTASCIVQGALTRENKKVNRRIELLQRILKQEREHKTENKQF